MKKPACEVLPYSPKSFRDILAEPLDFSKPRIQSKLHCLYFDEYFSKVSAKTIVVEREYIDRDYIEDFSAYYVRCFHDYTRTCTRLHFFSSDFDQNAFDGFLESSDDSMAKDLQEHYLGFIVAKPLPDAVIGRTCLKPYPKDGRRHFPTIRQYEANLFGHPFLVKTLAFQEQDKVAAACATSALWTAFQGTGKIFQHRISSPVEITQSATKHGYFLDKRALPSEGLDTYQIAYAIREVGLEPTLIGATNAKALKENIYAYTSLKVPVLLLGIVYCHWPTGTPVPKGKSSYVVPTGIWIEVGLHAITVTGYSLADSAAVAIPPDDLGVRASAIDKLYCHDDQLGPFAKLEFDTSQPFPSLLARMPQGSSAQSDQRFVPMSLMVPLYHKIRIPYSSVRRDVTQLEELVAANNMRLVWDIALTTVAQLKEDIAADASLLPLRKDLLTRRMPRFIWRAVGSNGGSALVELLFDATDVIDHSSCLYVVHRNTTFESSIRNLVKMHNTNGKLEALPAWRVLRHYA